MGVDSCRKGMSRGRGMHRHTAALARATIDGAASLQRICACVYCYAMRRMLALPKIRLKKAAPYSEAEGVMPIPAETVLRTLPSPPPKGLLRCEMRAVA
ncbi:hypothetical protein XpiCFBP4643_16590 [Xanthomonas pisi]|uniref:Uncharacterized protein n=1 Tax=Xanthomonas pisi TaxID=56457 RepID=A0A2S7D071_9XANT|nr:hypothetical protein XpiCFBP4643_16590 [Xanthomonas pisi]